MNKKPNVRTYSREDRSLSLAPLDFDEAVTDLLSVPAPPKDKPEPKTKDAKPRRTKR